MSAGTVSDAIHRQLADTQRADPNISHLPLRHDLSAEHAGRLPTTNRSSRGGQLNEQRPDGTGIEHGADDAISNLHGNEDVPAAWNIRVRHTFDWHPHRADASNGDRPRQAGAPSGPAWI